MTGIEERLLLMIVEKAWFAFDVGLKREEVAAELQPLLSTPEKIPAALEEMTNRKLAALDAATR